MPNPRAPPIRFRGKFRKVDAVRDFLLDLKNLRNPEDFIHLGRAAKIKTAHGSNISRTKTNHFFGSGGSAD